MARTFVNENSKLEKKKEKRKKKKKDGSIVSRSNSSSARNSYMVTPILNPVVI